MRTLSLFSPSPSLSSPPHHLNPHPPHPTTHQSTMSEAQVMGGYKGASELDHCFLLAAPHQLTDLLLSVVLPPCCPLATLSNPNTSEEAKQHAQDVLDGAFPPCLMRQLSCMSTMSTVLEADLGLRPSCHSSQARPSLTRSRPAARPRRLPTAPPRTASSAATRLPSTTTRSPRRPRSTRARSSRTPVLRSTSKRHIAPSPSPPLTFVGLSAGLGDSPCLIVALASLLSE